MKFDKPSQPFETVRTFFSQLVPSIVSNFSARNYAEQTAEAGAAAVSPETSRAP